MPTNVKFSYKTVAKADRGKLLDKIIQEQSKRLFQSTKMIREELDDNAKIQVDRQNEFFAGLRKAIGKLNATQIQNIQEYAAVETFGESDLEHFLMLEVRFNGNTIILLKSLLM